MDYAIVDNFFIESGLTFQRKGFHNDASDLYNISDRSETSTDVTTNLFYLQLPVLFNYKFNLGLVSLTPQVGPYFALGVGGKIKTETEIDGYVKVGDGVLKETESRNVTKTDAFDKYKCFDMGLRFALGVGIGSRNRIQFGYDLGCTDIVDADNVKSKNGSLFATYTFFIK